MKQNKNYEKQNEITTGGVKGHAGTCSGFCLVLMQSASYYVLLKWADSSGRSGQTKISLCRKQKR